MVTRQVKLEATLLTDSIPLPNKTIGFYHRVYGQQTWIYDTTDVTDENGKASKIITVDVPESYDFRAYFAGDDDYDASEAIVENYRVKAKTTITLEVTPL